VLFPFSEYWWFYAAFGGLVACLLSVDLMLHRNARAVSWREAALWTGVWIALALVFNYALYLFAAARLPAETARRLSLEFLAGYVVEESLSVDNMFVFALIFRHFAIPERYQHKVLFYGVAGAMVFRAIFVAVGAALVRFEWVLILFGVFLIVTGIRMALEREKQIEPGKSALLRWASRLFPMTEDYSGGRLFQRIDGVRHGTPLLMVVLLLETTDIMFAVDSVPAVFAVTREPLIVYTSNVFAILGLRSLYFLLSGAMDRFHLLRYGLAAILVFVGLKMTWLDHLFGGRFPIGISLAIIGAVIGAAIGLSLVVPQRTTCAQKSETTTPPHLRHPASQG
jgi:tellurite resistance protein TerC